MKNIKKVIKIMLGVICFTICVHSTYAQNKKPNTKKVKKKIFVKTKQQLEILQIRSDTVVYKFESKGKTFIGSNDVIWLAIIQQQFVENNEWYRRRFFWIENQTNHKIKINKHLPKNHSETYTGDEISQVFEIDFGNNPFLLPCEWSAHLHPENFHWVQEFSMMWIEMTFTSHKINYALKADSINHVVIHGVEKNGIYVESDDLIKKINLKESKEFITNIQDSYKDILKNSKK